MPKTKVQYNERFSFRASSELQRLIQEILKDDFYDFTYEEKPKNRMQIIRAALYVYIRIYHKSVLDRYKYKEEEIPEFYEHLKSIKRI
jgi:uncharacterized protein YecE (DUF72 family)